MARPTSSNATVDTTKTYTSTSSKAVSTRRKTRIDGSPNVFQTSSAQWGTMNGDEKNSYAALAGTLADPLAASAPPNKSGYSTFVALSAANIAVSQNTPATAAPYVPAPGLPPMQLLASVVGGRLSLVLVTNTPYPYPVALKAARPSYVANTIYKSSSFKKIGSVPSLATHADITALYQAHYRVPGTGYKIAVEVMGVAPGGYHTSGLYVIGIVSGVAQAAVYTDPETADNSPSAQLKMG